MTVNTVENRKTYNGNGATTAFTTPYFLADADLAVYVDNVLQTITTHYTVAGAGVPAGGTVTFITAPPTGTSNVVIIRDPPLTQLLDLVENDINPAATREAAFDKLTMISQRLSERNNRAFRISDSDPTAVTGLELPLPAARASLYVAFDAAGDLAFMPATSETPAAVQVVNGVATLRTIAPAATRFIRTRYHTNAGDGGHGDWRPVTGAAPGTYVDNNGTIIVPTGGDGSAAWLRDLNKPLVVTIEMFGGMADNSTESASPANKAITWLVSQGGGRLEFNGAGTYLLNHQGANPYKAGHKHCINISGNNIEIYISPASTLKLANGQQTDAGGPVDIVTMGAGRSNITIHGGGKITGNTAGQTGWTGGYAQNVNGNIVDSYGDGLSDITISNVKLTDHFSNPINIGLATVTTRHKNIVVDAIYAENTGEGCQIMEADGVRMTDCTQVCDGITMAGDGIEISECTDFYLSGIRITKKSGTPAGSAIDLFGSKHGVVDGFLVDGWVDAFGLSSSAGITVDDVVISNGAIKNLSSTNCIGEPEGHVIFNNIRVESCANATLMQIAGANTLPPIELNNVLGIGVKQFLVTGSRKVIWNGGGNRSSLNFGLDVSQSAAAQTRNLYLSNLDFTSAVTASIRFNSAGFGAQYIVGKMNGCISTNYSITDADDLSGFRIEACEPSLVSDNSVTPRDIGLYTTLSKSANNLTTFYNGAKNQKLLVRATAGFTVVDRTQAGGINIYLAGAVNYAMTADDSLLLDFDGTNWREVARSVN